MSAEHDHGLGIATEALLERAFSSTAMITAKAAAELLGLDPKTLGALTEAGVIRAVRAGASERTRRYTERDLRAYLIEGPSPCPSTSRPRAATSNMTSNGRVVAFTARRASKPDARPKR